METNSTTQSELQEFLLKMENISTTDIIADEMVRGMISGTHDLQSPSQLRVLLESFETLFVQREEFELCAELLKNNPQLNKLSL